MPVPEDSLPIPRMRGELVSKSGQPWCTHLLWASAPWGWGRVARGPAVCREPTPTPLLCGAGVRWGPTAVLRSRGEGCPLRGLGHRCSGGFGAGRAGWWGAGAAGPEEMVGLGGEAVELLLCPVGLSAQPVFLLGTTSLL